MRFARHVTTAAIAIAAVACAPAAADAGGEVSVNVRIRYSRFEPQRFAVEPGQTVTFVVHNADPIDHEFILGDDGVQLAHERGTEAYHPPQPGEMTVPAGETVTTTYAFEDPGPLIIGCHLPGHYAYGMRADVTIG